MKRFFGTSLKVLTMFFALLVALFFSIMIYGVSTAPSLDIDLITESSLNIDVFTNEGLRLQTGHGQKASYASLDKIPAHVKQAFISIEDKSFYEHSGINPQRILKAAVSNVLQGGFNQGASTITQQLIKNTHLTSEKTLSRKIGEISLALELEKRMTKDEILENYLNVIYFGSGQTGIENASQHYFSKPVQKLSLDEGALLAAIIKSPSRYSPTLHPENAKKRRNLVLEAMKNDGAISGKEFHDYAQKPLNLNLSENLLEPQNSYTSAAIQEAQGILNLTKRQLSLGGYKIYTYQDFEKQNKMNSLFFNQDFTSDAAMINISPQNGGILAYAGKSVFTILNHPRQIGSIVKPLLVYGPAVNENILSPASEILDEPITIGGYSPKNVSGTYSGYVSTRTALSKSLNIPAVKTASYLGLSKMQDYAKKLELPLNENDNSYAMALGGFTYGFTLKETAGAFTALANFGNFSSPRFVKYITNAEGNIVYRNPETKMRVFREDTAYLMTDMLKTCAKSGTARKLGDLNFEVAAKTGTVGNNKGNLDAYNVTYTTSDIVAVWMGNMNNTLIKTAGGNQPTALAKEYYKKIYSKETPKPFEMPSSVEKVQISLYELENNHRLVRANELVSPLETKTELFSRFNLPKNSMQLFSNVRPKLSGWVKNGKAVLRFNAVSSAKYEIYKKLGENWQLIKTYKNQSSAIELIDDLIPNKKTEYILKTYAPTGQILNSDIITLISSPVNQKTNWYI